MMSSAREAMLAAGYARIRPVLMTATAMMLGMLPMALGLGEGGEQNAPLGRAVIGGLAFATVTTLFVVPIIYSYLRVSPPVDHESRLVEASRKCPMMQTERSRTEEASALRQRRAKKENEELRRQLRESTGSKLRSIVVASIQPRDLGNRPRRHRGYCGGFLRRLHPAEGPQHLDPHAKPRLTHNACRAWT